MTLLRLVRNLRISTKLESKYYPYVQKGTKAEPHPKSYVSRPEYMNSFVDLSMPHNRRIKDGKVEVVRKGDDWEDYMIGAENARNNVPLFMQKTVMVEDPDDPASVALAFQKFENFQTKEGINKYYGHGYRFKEQPSAKRRRLAYQEAKKIARDELKKKIAFTMMNKRNTER